MQIADAEHVFFDYTPVETSATGATLLGSFRGHVIADAKSVYDFLYRPPDPQRPIFDGDEAAGGCTEVGCWAPARRKFWEAAVITQDPRAREGLARMMTIFAHERAWKKQSKAELAPLRANQLAPLIDDLLTWAKRERAAVEPERGLVRTALVYLDNQASALRTFLDDASLPMTNNDAERELRRITVGRKAWLLVGSDDHAQAAGNLLSLIATARRHGLDPERYLAELFRILPQWPRDRYLELWPAYWPRTRALLDPAQLATPVGRLTIPAEAREI